jgi:hypothetical protein
MKKKLAIVGAQEKTRGNAPWNDDSFDIWLFNEWANANWCQRWDAVLQLHKPKVYKGSNENDPMHWAWLQKEHEKPIYMQKVDPLVPDSVEYPYEAIRTHDLTYNGIEVENVKATASFAMALAIHLGYEEIHIYGIEMEHSSEYHSQQPNFAYWVGVANGKGIKVDLHCSKRLFDGPVYGYEGLPAENKLIAYKNGLNIQKAELEQQAENVSGAVLILSQLLEEGFND